jgi:hypothetical protein
MTADYFIKGVYDGFIKLVAEKTEEVFRFIFNAIQSFVIENWYYILIVFLILLVISLITHNKRMLGSLLYSFLYYSILYLIVLIFGSEIFASDWIKIVLFILYLICFTFVGKILRLLSLR